MIAPSKRLFPRKGCRLDIQYRTPDDDHYRDAILYNCSRVGMYFEPEALLTPDETIDILMPPRAHAAEGPERFSYYFARAVWCHSIPGEKGSRYGCGALLLKRSRQRNGRNAEAITHSCDSCGAAIPCQQLLKTDAFLYLCPSCQWQMASPPEGRPKRSIPRTLPDNAP
jgi:predicted RNA-binding Zn-ribbon protein involved in translation (DUF1610 family)